MDLRDVCAGADSMLTGVPSAAGPPHLQAAAVELRERGAPVRDRAADAGRRLRQVQLQQRVVHLRARRPPARQPWSRN